MIGLVAGGPDRGPHGRAHTHACAWERGDRHAGANGPKPSSLPGRGRSRAFLRSFDSVPGEAESLRNPPPPDVVLTRGFAPRRGGKGCALAPDPCGAWCIQNQSSTARFGGCQAWANATESIGCLHTQGAGCGQPKPGQESSPRPPKIRTHVPIVSPTNPSRYSNHASAAPRHVRPGAGMCPPRPAACFLAQVRTYP